MNDLFSLLCAVGVFVPAGVGLGAALLLERFWGRWAWLVGWVVSVGLFVIFYALYYLTVRLTPCEPAGSLTCGEPPVGALLLFGGMACVLAIGYGLAQTALFLFLQSVYAREAQPGEFGQEYAPEQGEFAAEYPLTEMGEGEAEYPPPGMTDSERQ